MGTWGLGLAVFVICVYGMNTLDCGGTVNASGSIITSPDYPLRYHENISCTWDIIARAGTSSIRIFFLDFSLTHNGRAGCNDGDFLAVLDGQGLEPEGRRFCSFYFPFRLAPDPTSMPPANGLVVTGNRAAIHFVAGDKTPLPGFNRRRGFKAQITWSTCPESQKCRTGQTEFVTDSDGCKQCVCKGCPPLECPQHCLSGTFKFKRPEEDCFQCRCKITKCPSNCSRILMNGEPVCNCRENTLAGAELRFPISSALVRLPNQGLITIEYNGQRRYICADTDDPEITYQNFSISVCNFIFPERDRDDFQLVPASAADLATVVSRGGKAPNLVYKFDPLCPVTGTDRNSLPNYVDCISGPFKFQEGCPEGTLVDVLCSFAIMKPGGTPCKSV